MLMLPGYQWYIVGAFVYTHFMSIMLMTPLLYSDGNQRVPVALIG